MSFSARSRPQTFGRFLSGGQSQSRKNNFPTWLSCVTLAPEAAPHAGAAFGISGVPLKA
jgi:hypothetical protein